MISEEKGVSQGNAMLGFARICLLLGRDYGI